MNATHDGYERQDWVDFRERVLELGDGPKLDAYLVEWGLGSWAGGNARMTAEDMQTIIDRLTPEGSEG